MMGAGFTGKSGKFFEKIVYNACLWANQRTNVVGAMTDTVEYYWPSLNRCAKLLDMKVDDLIPGYPTWEEIESKRENRVEWIKAIQRGEELKKAFQSSRTYAGVVRISRREIRLAFEKKVHAAVEKLRTVGHSVETCQVCQCMSILGESESEVLRGLQNHSGSQKDILIHVLLSSVD